MKRSILAFLLMSFVFFITKNSNAQCDIIYAGPNGLSTNSGTASSPFDIETALSQACVLNTKHVRILGGTYTISNKLILGCDDLIIDGDWEIVAGIGRKNSNLITIINIDSPLETVAYDGASGTNVGVHIGVEAIGRSNILIQDITFHVKNGGSSGSVIGTTGDRGNSVYGFYFVNSNGWHIERCDMNTGSASRGSNGANGAPSLNGNAGGTGGDGDCDDDNAPNAGGVAGAAVGTGTRRGERGGAGGEGADDFSNNQDGSNGLNGGGGAAAGNSFGSRGANGGCGSDSNRDGRAGENGASGANGSNGVTITASTIFSYFWLPTAKSGDGTDGAGGGGGEGGGGGGRDSGVFCIDGSGGGGGGGGSGGQGGQAGTGGWGAGSSFAMYLHSSVGTSNNTILTPGAVAEGGDGGDGADGGLGGGHGQGGGGNNVNLGGCCSTTLPRVCGNTDVGAGGRGGKGGNGGNGGDGADGADGLSVSVQTVAGGSLTPATSGPIANTISTEILEGCQNSEILIVKDGGTWSLTNGGVYINDLNSGSSSYNNNSANAYISFPATGMKSIDINGVAYDGFILINKTRALPVFDATMESGICEGNSFIMSTSTTGDEYEWVIFNDAASTGNPLATFSTSTASWSTPVTGTATDYKVRLRVKTNCCGWSTPVYYSFSTSATLTGSEISTICYEDTLTINGTYYHANNSTGTEVFTNIGPNGCDSTVTINLNVIPEKVGSVTQTICYEDTLTINGTYYHANNASGTEVFANIGPNGCDSTVTINLTVIPEKVGNVTETICDGDTLFVGNSFYTASVTGGTEVISNIGPNGCDSTVTIDLTVLPPIDVTLTNNAAILTSNENGASYVWLDCDNNYAALSGETDQMFEASLNGNYAVEITLGNCVDTSDCETINSVGITELSNDLISIYPNPTNNIVTVSLNNAIGELNYEVRTIEGKIIVKKSNINSDQFTIDLSLESDGVYFLNISSKEDSKVFKIIKQ